MEITLVCTHVTVYSMTPSLQSSNIEYKNTSGDPDSEWKILQNNYAFPFRVQTVIVTIRKAEARLILS
jgi:hypothetical protein